MKNFLRFLQLCPNFDLWRLYLIASNNLQIFLQIFVKKCILAVCNNSYSPLQSSLSSLGCGFWTWILDTDFNQDFNGTKKSSITVFPVKSGTLIPGCWFLDTDSGTLILGQDNESDTEFGIWTLWPWTLSLGYWNYYPDKLTNLPYSLC